MIRILPGLFAAALAWAAVAYVALPAAASVSNAIKATRQ